MFGGPLDEAVFDLEPCDSHSAAQFGDSRGTCHPPGGEIRKTGVKNLSGADQVIKATHDFLSWRHLIKEMDPEKIDTIGLETLEAGFDRRNHGLAAVSGDEEHPRRVQARRVLCSQEQV